ncbi:RNA polymerase sigma factor [Falsibacillus albus]|uniref:RNA polymerase sigma-70 region 2 domain-containing protein n=1 Tax=Falsibacillus albus TaxID=2478915 RepID=A0A3L7K1H7_9BACI|nr:hypothetical protein [Falsibacillus albus]RLQ96239.1 hypothetical protein D9X91_08105 [Falsibacillus albus]
MKDRILIEGVLNKDRSCLECLYDKYSPLLFSYLFKTCGDTKLSEEIIITIFSQIWINPVIFFANQNISSRILSKCKQELEAHSAKDKIIS